jgi:hypothetical protein
MPAEILAETFVELADTLVDDFDPIDFMHMLADRCVDILDVNGAGLLLADHHGALRVVGASSERARLLELFELQNRQGPCMECYLTGRPVTVTDLGTGTQRWPEFAAMATDAGFGSAQALPMRLRAETVGALNLFRVSPQPLDESATRIAQAMADVATIGLLQQRGIRRREVLAEQLQGALHSRVIIEQAKGVLAERLRIDVEQAFAILRAHSRQHNQLISSVAEAVVTGTIDMAVFTGAEPR